MMPRAAGRRGVTIPELAVAFVVLAILSGVISLLLRVVLKGATKTDHQFIVQEEIRAAFDVIERDIFTSTELVQAGGGEIVVRLESHRIRGYARDGDLDGDGTPNIDDPDDDNDGLVFPDPWANPSLTGDDLVDDDDDGDGRIDVECRFRLVGPAGKKDLVVEYKFNSNNVADFRDARTLVRDVNRFELSYFGAANEALPDSDTPMGDPVAGIDTLVRDQIITLEEIDQSPFGNGNGSLDTVREFACVRSIDILIEKMSHGAVLGDAGRKSFVLRTEIAPPLWPMKRRP